MVTIFKGVNSKNADFLIFNGKCVRLRFEVFIPEYMGMLLDKRELKHRFNIGSKIIEATFIYFKKMFPKQYSTFIRAKYAIDKKGNRNGYSGPPRPLIPKQDLLKALNSGIDAVEIYEKFHITEFLFHRNLEWHNLREEWYNTRHLRIVRRLQQEEYLSDILNKIFPYYAKDMRSASSMQSKIKSTLRVYCELYRLVFIVKNIGKFLQRREKDRLYSFGINYGEYIVLKHLLDRNVDFRQQYIIEKYRYDFYIPATNTLVEVNGSSHSIEPVYLFNKSGVKNYEHKKVLAKKYGYNLIELNYESFKITNLEILDLYAPKVY